MKIFIIGPCSTGKSTLAQYLSQKLLIPYICLDDLFIDFGSITMSHHAYYPTEKVDENIRRVTELKNWIVEGPYAIDVFFEESDLIVFTSRSLIRAIFWQWKRVFTDPLQLKRWGIINNLILSKLIFHQYIDKSDTCLYQGVKYPTLANLKNRLHHFGDKVIILGARSNNRTLFKQLGLLE